MLKGLTTNVNGNEDWCGLKRKLLDVASEVCGYTKGKPRYFEMWCGGIKKWILLCLERKRYLRFGNRMRKIERNIVRQKKMLRESYFIAVSVKPLCYRCCVSSL